MAGTGSVERDTDGVTFAEIRIRGCLACRRNAWPADAHASLQFGSLNCLLVTTSWKSHNIYMKSEFVYSLKIRGYANIGTWSDIEDDDDDDCYYYSS